jgi:aryl-alcohol dehydrogenase-like predicted oxidoreductase
LEWLKDAVLNEEKLKKAEQLQTLADELDVSLAKFSLAWCLKNPHVSTVILGASKTEQLDENLTALEVLPLLTDEVMDRIEVIVQTKPKIIQF